MESPSLRGMELLSTGAENCLIFLKTQTSQRYSNYSDDKRIKRHLTFINKELL